METPDGGIPTGIALEIPVSDDGAMTVSCSPPERLIRRLSEVKISSPATVEEIEAKLQHAHIRRQKFYEHLSSKARPKPRSRSQPSSTEDDRGLRLEAKLQAAEKKRLIFCFLPADLLIGHFSKGSDASFSMRFRRERAELSSKVESRVKKAEINRMLILKAHKQRRLSLKERTYQSLLRRMTRESNYKERVCAAVHQKRAAAEKKRLGLLEAERKRASARILQVRKVAKCISRQCEIERQDMQNKLEDRLQRAKRQRAEYLMQRGKGQNSVHTSWNKFQEEADLLSSKLAGCWKQFRKINETTLQLAKSYDALNINRSSAMSKPFEQLALIIESGPTLQTTKALLDRFECRYVLARSSTAMPCTFASDDIDHLLQRVATPRRRATPRKSTASRGTRKPGPLKQSQSPKTPVKLSRYQVRIILCAYMILGHPSSVFSGEGEREIALAQSAGTFVREFELLIKTILCGPIQVSNTETGPLLAKFRSQLAAFDSAWCSYLNDFVLWKVKDAESLEGDLVRAACHLELSMMQTCKMTPEGDSASLTHDMKAIQRQVTQDQKLLRQKVYNLSGDAGIARVEAAISDTRAKYFQTLENGSPVGSAVAQIKSPISASIRTSHPKAESATKGNGLTENALKPNVARRLFRDENHSNGFDMGKDLENELLVNESVHGEQLVLDENMNFGDKIQSRTKEKVKETMKKAFWDGIIESVEQNEHKFGHIIELMREVRDEISLMAPGSWKQEIFEAIDIEILSQVLSSGNLDMDYLGKVLGFALVKLQKLSAPGRTDELKATHQKFMEELADTCRENGPSKKLRTIALVKGLRFVLEQIQILKEEVSRARIQLLQPLLKGPAGLAFLRKSFTNHYGAPGDSANSLPLTRDCLLSVVDSKDQEWADHSKILSELSGKHGTTPERLLAPTTLKTGGHFPNSRIGSPDSLSASSSAISYSGCQGEKVDLMVRLGLLKLVTEISGVTEESLPETLKLNFLRLRAVQAGMQKITTVATSVLVLRQTLLCEMILSSHGDIDDMALSCVKQLSDLLDTVEDAGISEITELLSQIVNDVDNSTDKSKRQSLKEIMACMLTKSLQAGDTVFNRVSRAIYLGARGVILSGSGPRGTELAAISLRQIGAVGLVNELVTAASVLGVVATVSVNVHGPWYTHLVDSM